MAAAGELPAHFHLRPMATEIVDEDSQLRRSWPRMIGAFGREGRGGRHAAVAGRTVLRAVARLARYSSTLEAVSEAAAAHAN